MQYAILCYHDEAAVDALTQGQDDALMADLAVVGEALVAEGRVGPVARLMPTTAATTLRYGHETVVLDGPFAETKEAMLGLYVIACGSLDEAIEITRRLIEPRVRAGLMGTMEIRPVRLYLPDRRRA